jgi:oligopeptide/dipeptide ABC transporter ATP-binding protein
VQAQIIDLLNEIRRDTGMAMVVISHDLGVISAVSDRVVVMYAGRIVESSDINTLFSSAGHPYTLGLLAAIPTLDSTSDRLLTIQGSVPEPGKLPTGCSFSPRCDYASDDCHHGLPAAVVIKPGHLVRCLNTPIQ